MEEVVRSDDEGDDKEEAVTDDGEVDSDDNLDEEEENEEDADDEEEDEEELAVAEEQAATSALTDDDHRSGEEEEDDAGETYLKKLDPAMRQSLMAEFHPELLMENNQDVQAKTIILRDEHGNIDDPLHRTMPILTKYEKARILGERAKQLNAGAVPMVEVPEYVMDGYLIAMQEFEAKKIPFIIKRPLRNNTCEYWKFCDLEIL